MTSSNGNIYAFLTTCEGNSPVNPSHKGQPRGAMVFSLICVWIKGWVNNREAGDLRRYRAHYDVIVMPNTETQMSFWRNFRHWSFVFSPLPVLPVTKISSKRRHSCSAWNFAKCFNRVENERKHYHEYAQINFDEHDDVIKWKHFTRYWPFVRRI